MSEQEAYIWLSPARRNGEACIGGTRLPCRQMAEAWWESTGPLEELLHEYPTLTREGLLLSCWYYAAIQLRWHSSGPQWRWRKWLVMNELALAHSDWAAVELPPRKAGA